MTSTQPAGRACPDSDPHWRQTPQGNINYLFDFCFETTFFSSLFIADCQRGPRARKCRITSGERRMLICSRLLTTGGRPRRTSLSPSYTSAFLKYSSVNSGASSGSVQVLFPARFFFCMAVPHRNNVPCVLTRRPHDHNHPAGEIPGRDITRFIVTVGSQNGVSAKEYLFGIGEV